MPVTVNHFGNAASPWFQLVGVAVGALIGAGVASWTSRNLARHAEAKETRVLQISKLEEAVERIGQCHCGSL